MPGFAVTETSQIAQARRAIGAMAKAIGLEAGDAGRAALVATEICTNIVKHGGGGELIATSLEEGGRGGLQLLGLDRGPGMSDVAKCLRDGFSTAGSPGTGLGAISRLSQSFEVYSQPDRGTAVLAQLWPEGRPPSPRPIDIGAVVVPKPGETECGDAWCCTCRGSSILVLGVDGLGHGLGAAQAAAAACRSFEGEKHRTLPAILEKIHVALRSTRGAAAALAEIDWERGELVAVGIGNLVTAIVTQGAVKRLASYNGIVGHATPRVHEVRYPVAPGSVIIMHTDGLGTNWQTERYPGLMSHGSAVIAGVLYRDCRRGRDDSMVIVVKRATA